MKPTTTSSIRSVRFYLECCCVVGVLWLLVSFFGLAHDGKNATHVHSRFLQQLVTKQRETDANKQEYYTRVRRIRQNILEADKKVTRGTGHKLNYTAFNIFRYGRFCASMPQLIYLYLIL